MLSLCRHDLDCMFRFSTFAETSKQVRKIQSCRGASNNDVCDHLLSNQYEVE